MLIDVARAGCFSFDSGPQSAQLCVFTVHSEATFDHRPCFAELLLSVVLLRPSQKALSQVQPAQTSLHTLDGLRPVETQGLAEVLQSCPLSGTKHQAATSPTQIFCPDFRVV